MNKLEELINGYKKMTIPLFLKDVTDNREELLKSYEDYIKSSCEIIVQTKNADKLSALQLLDIFLPSEIKRIEGLTLLEKQMLYIKDSKYQELYSISYKGFDLAKEYIENSTAIPTEEAANSIAKMKAVVKDIKPFNMNGAKRLLSEGILDYNTARGVKEVTSFRLHRYIDSKKNNDMGTFKEGRYI